MRQMLDILSRTYEAKERATEESGKARVVMDARDHA